MSKKRYFMEKIISMQLLLIVILAMIFNIIIGVSTSYAATTYKQEKKQGIDAFPDSYKSYLKELQDLHSNWSFIAFNTGMTWQDFISKETSSHLKNTVHNSSSSLWKDSCGKVASGYACASQPILEYYADPRNFLTESRIFQFLEMTYNPSVHTKAGVESLLKGSFMDKTVDIPISKDDSKTQKMSYAEIIMKAAEESKISPYSIAIKIFQEVGRQGSSSVTGTYQGYEGYYNFFNYGAYDSGNAIEICKG